MRPTRHRIVIQPAAIEDLDQIMAYIAEHSPLNAATLIDRILNRIRTLATLPRRCPYARENGAFPEELRQLVVGSYRVIFTVQKREVHVLRVRHAARQPLGRDDL